MEEIRALGTELHMKEEKSGRMSSTPRPWIVTPDGYRIYSTLPDVTDCFDKMICILAHNIYERTLESQGNAKLIVEAVNSHDSLIEQRDALAGALAEMKNYLAIMKERFSPVTDLVGYKDVMSQAEAALAKVRE